MGLQLSAEQKCIMDLYVNETLFVIPAFQRSYSWGYDHCRRLFQDMLRAYNDKTDYYLGNFIFAHGLNAPHEYVVVDGQQRIVTLWIFLKVASLLFPNLKQRLQRIIYIQDWSETGYNPRISSMIFEEDDEGKIQYVSNMTKELLEEKSHNIMNSKGVFSLPKFHNVMESNAFFFYSSMDYRIKMFGLKDTESFIRFVVENVFFLPIELSDEDAGIASNRALTIFETLNDRGLSLTDSDIFKEKLYRRSIMAKKETDFISKWTELRQICSTINVEIDDIFRYYLHIIRGINKNPGYTQSLREFFISNSLSPLLTASYDKVIDDLNKIVESVTLLNYIRSAGNELAAWVQLLVAYTNRYPYYAVVAYLYRHPDYKEEELIQLIKSLVRYCYYRGATTTVSYEMYSIISKIMHDEKIDDYYQPQLTDEFFDSPIRLRNAYVLLAFYLEHKEGLPFHSIDKILTYNDVTNVADWHVAEETIECLGNMIVLDCHKRYGDFKAKCVAYSSSSIQEVKKVFDRNNGLPFQLIQQRDRHMKEILLRFFKGN